jgi:hypothetical protein
MSYQVAKTGTNILSGAVVMIFYLLYVSSSYQAGLLAMDDLKSWAQVMLIFIGIGIALAIVVQIIFHILFSIGLAVNQSIKNGNCDDQEIEKTIKLEMVEDEMGKLIELKSMRVAYITVGIGFVASLLFLFFDYPSFIALNVLFVSFFLGSILEGFTQLYYYKRGV